jgi:plasmid stabilization system protein ParE
LVIVPLPFIVVYRVKDELVEIVRLIHGAQEWPRKA